MSGEQWTPVKLRGGGAPAGAPGGPPAGGGAPGGRPGAQAWASKNKVVLGAGAVGLVVVLALLNRGKGSDSATPTGTTVSGSTGGQGTYDSSASDIYNALQPQVEGLQNMLESWQAGVVPVPGTPATSVDVTTPVATAPTATTVPIGSYTAQQVQDIFKSPVGSDLASKGILPPADAGAKSSQQQADYGKSYEAAWEARNALKK